VASSGNTMNSAINIIQYFIANLRAPPRSRGCLVLS